MSDSGRQIGDCKHAKQRDRCPECSHPEIREIYNEINIVYQELIDACENYNNCTDATERFRSLSFKAANKEAMLSMLVVKHLPVLLPFLKEKLQ